MPATHFFTPESIFLRSRFQIFPYKISGPFCKPKDNTQKLFHASGIDIDSSFASAQLQEELTVESSTKKWEERAVERSEKTGVSSLRSLKLTDNRLAYVC